MRGPHGAWHVTPRHARATHIRHARVPLAPAETFEVTSGRDGSHSGSTPAPHLWQCMSRAVEDASQAIPPILALLSLSLSLGA